MASAPSSSASTERQPARPWARAPPASPRIRLRMSHRGRRPEAFALRLCCCNNVAGIAGDLEPAFVGAVSNSLIGRAGRGKDQVMVSPVRGHTFLLLHLRLLAGHQNG